MDHLHDHEEDEHEHEVYGGEIPDEGEMDADVDMSSRAEEDEYQDPNSKVCSIWTIIAICLWNTSSFFFLKSLEFFYLVFVFFIGFRGYEEKIERDRRRSRCTTWNAG